MTLEDWIKEEQQIVKIVKAGIGTGIPKPEDLQNKTGLQVIQGMLSGEVPIAPIADVMNFITISAEPGKAIFQAEPTLEFLNPMGTVHGGWMSTVMDSAMGSAILSALPENKAYTTQSLSVIFKKRLSLDVKRIRVIAEVSKDLDKLKTARSSTVRASLVDAQGTVYAVSKSTCRIFRTA